MARIILTKNAIPAGPEVPEATPGLAADRKGFIKVESEETGRTSWPSVFVGGDDVRGADLVVTAAARGAADAMNEYLKDLKRTRVIDGGGFGVSGLTRRPI